MTPGELFNEMTPAQKAELIKLLAETLPDRRIVVVGDSAYTNRSVIKGRPANVTVVGRSRLDAVRRAARQEQFLEVVSPEEAQKRFSTHLELSPFSSESVSLDALYGMLNVLGVKADSAAGEYLAKMGLPEEDFNSYATHRGDHLTTIEAAFEQENPGGVARPQPRVKPINRQQSVLRPVEVERLVEEDHPVRAIWELVGRLLPTDFYSGIKAVEGTAGQAAFDPQLLTSLWVYAYSRGVGSAREIARLCEYHPAYQWLTGLEAVNYHSLSDFRTRHPEALSQLFTEVLGLLSHAVLITLERVMQDGRPR